MNLLRSLWPGRPSTDQYQTIQPVVADADIAVIEDATSYVLKGEAVPESVLTDVRRIRRTGFFLADALTIQDRESRS